MLMIFPDTLLKFILVNKYIVNLVLKTLFIWWIKLVINKNFN